MKKLQLIALTAAAVTLFTGSAIAQKKAAKKTTVKKTASSNTIVPPLAVRTTREKVGVQQENVNFWIDKLGPIASALELLDQAYATKKPSQATLATHEDRKQKFVQTLRNLRSDLSMLESEFRTKPELQKYLPNIQGITELAAQAEDSAIADKFVASKEPLRAVAAKLTDTLAVMPR
jgi:hypothetical protein